MESKWSKTWMENRPQEKPQSCSLRHIKWVILLSLVFTVLVGFVIFLIARKPQSAQIPKEGHSVITTQKKKNKFVNHNAGEPKKQVPMSPSLSNSKEKESPNGTGEKWLGVEIDHKTIMTNGQYILETIYTVDGKMHRYAHSSRPRIFDNTSDQLLSLATSDPDGTAPLPDLGKNFEEEFIKSLKSEIVIDSNDPPEVRKIKENVKLARKNLLEAIQQGQTAEEVIRMDREAKMQAAELRDVAVKGLHVYLEKGDEEGAAIYLEKMNQKLEEMGLMKLELPKKRGK